MVVALESKLSRREHHRRYHEPERDQNQDRAREQIRHAVENIGANEEQHVKPAEQSVLREGLHNVIRLGHARGEMDARRLAGRREAGAGPGTRHARRRPASATNRNRTPMQGPGDGTCGVGRGARSREVRGSG